MNPRYDVNVEVELNLTEDEKTILKIAQKSFYGENFDPDLLEGKNTLSEIQTLYTTLINADGGGMYAGGKFTDKFESDERVREMQQVVDDLQTNLGDILDRWGETRVPSIHNDS